VSEIATSIGPGVTGLHVELDDPASIRAGFTEGPVIDHLVLVPIDQLATSVKNFDVAAANKAVHVKLTGYIELVHTVLPRLKPSSSIVLFSGLASISLQHGSTRPALYSCGPQWVCVVGRINDRPDRNELWVPDRTIACAR